MANVLQNAISAALKSVRASAGVVVDYTQGATTVNDCPAIPGSTTTESEFADGVVRTDKSHDFIIEREDLPFTPAKGDRIVWNTRTYDVMHPANGRVYEDIGPFRQAWRIHTKEVNGS